MIVGRILGWLFLVGCVPVLVRDFAVSFELRRWAPITLGQLWYDIDPTSLALAQAGVERYVNVHTWSVIDRMLNVWACGAFLLIGIGLTIAFAPRHDIID